MTRLLTGDGVFGFVEVPFDPLIDQLQASPCHRPAKASQHG
jgi:hypothetical protein